MQASMRVDLEHPAATPAASVSHTSRPPVKSRQENSRSTPCFRSESFQITQHILDSRPRLLAKEDGTPLRDEHGTLVVLPGISTIGLLSANLGLRLAAVIAAAVVSVGIGLMISALVANTTQNMLWVPLVLIPQILFGGIVVQVPDMSRSVDCSVN